MQHVLRVALQVADSVAVLSAAVESLQSRVAALEERQERQAAERVTAATLSAVIERVVAVEALAADAETRTRTFGNLHEQMFQQFTQLKRDVLGAHNPSAPPSHSRVAPTEADVMTPVGAVGRAAPALAAGAPPSSERPAVPSPQRQATFAAPTESLSDMIKHMEMKLQKIRIPAK
jgi:hypothetical protein